MIQGKTLRDAIISGANNISTQKIAVDELNVFPVPDGDTGTNMSMTINAAARELALLPDNTPIGEVAGTAASALLRGARGNSGVILSLLFRGFSKALKGKTEADGADIAEALSKGVAAAYKAVMKPTEGTILTVAREAGEKAVEVSAQNKNEVEIFELICQQANETLNRTPEMLPVLKKAGVVDAGGKGFCVIFEGMLSVIRDGKMIPAPDQRTAAAQPSGNAAGNMSRNAAGQVDEEITFTYCTEFIVLKQPEIQANSVKLRAYLESIGDCVVVVDDESIIKVHVHTDNPGKAISGGLKNGMLTNIKIENMRLQHEDQKASVAAQAAKEKYVPVDESVKYGFVSVCAGDGVAQLFTDLGVNAIVSGGQTMNPSTDDILHAIHSVPAKTVIVLPNNKNIIMAAEQAINLADRRVIVLPTKTIPQGLAAMFAFNEMTTPEENQREMCRAAERVGTGQLTFAARDSEYDGYQIKKDEILALENGKVAFVEKDLVKAGVKLIRNLVKKDSSFVTIITGADATEAQANQIVEAVRPKLGQEIDITVVDGGQPVYYFIIYVE
ncbi:MAG: DAK2 domain-containing protein [Oscillospiraceae bacterium]|nr:DAK2 domain-containing protein [Oscillospiraceae bacterium]